MAGKKITVVGAGFAGATVARQLADAGFGVTVLEKRDHIGGNAYDFYDEHGILVHQYGPHIFHTNGARIAEYLSRFTDWRPYEHKVLASVNGELYPFPINRTTLNKLYGLDLDEAGAAEFLEKVRIPIENPRTSEEVVLNAVGRELCDLFFRGYTRKQWCKDLSELSASVAARIPTRTSDDDRYFQDSFQNMPKSGYTALFGEMLNSPNISVELEVDYLANKSKYAADHLVFTGPIDAFFDYRFGKLPYRSLEFQHEHYADTEWFQPVGTMNFPNEHEYTRITEFKHLTGQVHPGTSIVKEFPRSEGEPYYPIPCSETEEIYQRYKSEAEKMEDTTFVGRLAQYRYYNMDQVVGAALTAAQNILSKLGAPNA